MFKRFKQWFFRRFLCSHFWTVEECLEKSCKVLIQRRWCWICGKMEIEDYYRTADGGMEFVEYFWRDVSIEEFDEFLPSNR